MTCDNCLAGNHGRCRSVATCPCEICKKKRSKPAASKVVAKPAPKPTKTAKPKEPLKTRQAYPMELVMQAAAMRQARYSWRDIGLALDVPAEGIRYAVNHYDYEPPPPLFAPPDMTTALASAHRAIVSLEDSVAQVETALAELRAFVAAASDTSSHQSTTSSCGVAAKH